jgi:flagellar biosynthesis chaperone FliJ
MNLSESENLQSFLTQLKEIRDDLNTKISDLETIIEQTKPYK